MSNGEESHRKEYKEAEDRQSEAEHMFREYGGHAFSNAGPNLSTARERIKKLYGEANAEADALNKEYDRLSAQAKETLETYEAFRKVYDRLAAEAEAAARTLKDFAREKLDIKKKEEDSPVA